jgi:hypothetical protein
VIEINRAEVVREVNKAFRLYENALMASDAQALTEMFWDSELSIRFGDDEVLFGIAAIAEFRRRYVATDVARRLTQIVTTTFGHDVATVYSVAVYRESGRTGRQSQTWLRTDAGWRVANAHVSWPLSDARSIESVPEEDDSAIDGARR